MYSEITAVCFQIQRKHINILRGPNVDLLSVEMAVHRLNTEF